MTIKRFAIAAALALYLLAGPGDAHAQNGSAKPVPNPATEHAARTPITWVDGVREKNFYLLSTLDRDAAVRSAILGDPALQKIGAAKRDSLARVAGSCEATAACYADNLRFSADEIDTASKAVASLYRANPALRNLVEGPLRDSGMFELYEEMPGDELLTRAWNDAAKGINNLIGVYGQGNVPRYPEIDSITYDPASESYVRLLHIIVSTMQDDAAAMDLFFEPSLEFALHLMNANHRDEAGRYEPMHLGENAAAFARIPGIDWTNYNYTVIVIPGSGNDGPDIALSPWGKMRLTLAARRYHDGLAPLLIVSGGFVHPNQTPYAEAIEMKRSLMEEFGVPEEAILIDPHARHTTTNLRNAARIMYRYGIPTDRIALITTDLYQSEYIESDVFVERCDNELGYQPHQLLRRTSPSDLEFLPRIDSLHADVADPLDP